ncbi:MAG: TolC family protein, partial [Balneolaceae bacterium]|nr:TolC family protein [Balneolaceae bacterium]
MEFKRILILKIASALSAILLMTAAMHGTVLAQEAEQDSRVVHLSMEEAVTRALRHNLGLQATQQDVAISRSQFRSANALFLPTISVEESAVTTNNPLNTFGFLLKQEIVTTADFNPDFLNDPDPIDNFTTKIQIQQPLFNPDGYFKRGALKDQLKASREQLKRAEYYVEYLVRQQYYALMLSVREVGIVDTSLTAARANYEQASDFFKQGMIDRADLLLAEVRVKELESRRSAALQKKEEAQQQLAYLTGMEETVEFRLTDRMTLPRVDTVRVEYERLNSRRSDMKALGWMVKASEKQVNAAKFSFAPSINLFGSYEWNDDRLLGMDAGSY